MLRTLIAALALAFASTTHDLTMHAKPARYGPVKIYLQAGIASTNKCEPGSTCRGHTARHREHRPAVLSAFDLCVAGHESGAGEIVTPANARAYAHDIDWRAEDAPYSGAFQWDASTWAAAGGLRYGSASSASPEDQARVFDSYEPSHSGAWPESVPACGG